MAKQRFTGVSGLPITRRALKELKLRGIFAHSIVSLEHQHLAQCYVIRALESGGCTGDVGRYVSFADIAGQPLPYLQLVESIAVNGLHAVVVSDALVRMDLLRKGRTYELLITSHSIIPVENGARPQLQTEIVFRGFHGRLELDLSGRDKAQSGRVVPSFLSLGGEQMEVPVQFLSLLRAATKGVNCIGCSHAHYLRKPSPPKSQNGKLEAEATSKTGEVQSTPTPSCQALPDRDLAQALEECSAR